MCNMKGEAVCLFEGVGTGLGALWCQGGLYVFVRRGVIALFRQKHVNIKHKGYKEALFTIWSLS